jgi:hypothetical protein
MGSLKTAVRTCSPSNGLKALLFLSLFACSNNSENRKDSVLRSDSRVLDRIIDASQPNRWDSGQSKAQIGFNDQGLEQRLLLYFPGISDLYLDDAIMSSITRIQLRLAATALNVNPENIQLYPMSRPWTPQATWLHYLSGLKKAAWDTPGGDWLSEYDPMAPDLDAIDRSDEEVPGFWLDFDLTQMVTEMMVNEAPNYGFLLLVRSSPLNFVDRLEITTSDDRTANRRPEAQLIFYTKDTFVP